METCSKRIPALDGQLYIAASVAGAASANWGCLRYLIG